MKQPILILGATSAIAKCAAAIWAQRGHSLFLASHDRAETERIALDLSIRYDVQTRFEAFDITDISSHEAFIIRVKQEMGGIFGMLLACGYLGDQAKAAADFSEAQRIIDVNYTGACSILSRCADMMVAQQYGFIAAISSVAGDRGRQSNYFYGSAKGALSIFLQGLRNRLQSQNIHVLTVKPGFVDTAMTYGRPGMFLVASPNRVAEAVVKGVDKQKNEIYVPWFWRLIMGIICAIPECLFKRLKL
jgi:short-subunit dehydrogenase